MFEIVQEVHGLVGTPQAIDALAKKDHARVIICSDSHGKFTILEAIVRRFCKECDALFFCGDGAGDLARILLLAQNDEEFSKCLPPVVAFVRGNGDPSSYPLDMKRSVAIPNMQSLTVNGRNFMLVHGHREGVDFSLDNFGLEMQLENCSCGFYGHTHIAREDNQNGYKFVNPGSCSRPRGGQPAGFAIATVEKSFVDIAFVKINSFEPSDNQFQVWMPVY